MDGADLKCQMADECKFMRLSAVVKKRSLKAINQYVDGIISS